MRQKDFNEILTVLGTEVRTCDAPVEEAGLLMAVNAVMGYAAHRYPEVDPQQMLVAYASGLAPVVAPAT